MSLFVCEYGSDVEVARFEKFPDAVIYCRQTWKFGSVFVEFPEPRKERHLFALVFPEGVFTMAREFDSLL